MSDSSDWLVKLDHTTESGAAGTSAQRRLQITPISYANPHWHRQASLKSTETSKCSVQERDSMKGSDGDHGRAEARRMFSAGPLSMSVGGQSLINKIPSTAISMYIPFLKHDWMWWCAALCECKGCFFCVERRGYYYHPSPQDRLKCWAWRKECNFPQLIIIMAPCFWALHFFVPEHLE